MVRSAGSWVYCDAYDCAWYKPRSCPMAHDGREYGGYCSKKVIGVSTFPKAQWERSLGMAIRGRSFCANYQESMTHYRRRGGGTV